MQPINDQAWGQTPTNVIQGVAQQQNRVLRNTYLMLALSMVPTILGALIGVQIRFSIFAFGPVVGILLFFGIAGGLMYGVKKTQESATGVALLLGFTFFMGLMLADILRAALGFSNGGTLIALAAGGTGAIFMTLAGIASTTKRDFSGIGKFLFAGMVLVLVAMLANIFFQVPALSLALSALAVLIFSGYILYDINRIVHGGETNYISATLSVYLDIYNIFVNLLSLLMAFTGQRD